MAQRMDGRVFFEAGNNGVFALVSAEVQHNRDRFEQIRKQLCQHGRVRVTGREFDEALLRVLPLRTTPIFTFTLHERYKESSWFTGDLQMQAELINHIRRSGGSIDRSRPIFVPFSNGVEMGHAGLDAQCRELRFVTTDEDFVKEFGIYPQDLDNDA